MFCEIKKGDKIEVAIESLFATVIQTEPFVCLFHLVWTSTNFEFTIEEMDKLEK